MRFACAYWQGPGIVDRTFSDREAAIKINPTIPNQRIVLAILLLIALFHAWLASYSRAEDSGRTTYYYAYLSQAFLRGDLHLPLEPDPELLAMDNPYGLSARAELEKRGIVTPVDFSLYGGKFYLYWGPVPALLLSMVQIFSRQSRSIADFFLAFIFGTGILLAQIGLLTTVWRQYFLSVPVRAYYIALLLAGLLWPVALLRHEHNHARIYEAAIAAGQFFLILGLWIAFTSMTKPTFPNGRVALAGVLWVLAIGSRHLLIVPISFMVILTALSIFRTSAGLVIKITKFICLTLPLALGGALLAWYNWARFDSITETGYTYQLAGVDLASHLDELFSGSYVIQNLYNYLFNPPHLMSEFPFVTMLKGSKSPGLAFYYAEPMTGVLYMFPFAILAIVPLLLNYWNRPKADPLAETEKEDDRASLRWITLNLGGSFLISFLLLTIFFWAGMRYAADFLPSLTMLSAIGFWQGYRSVEHQPLAKKYYGTIGMILAGISIVISTLLAISTL